MARPDPAVAALAARLERRRVAANASVEPSVDGYADVIVVRGQANAPVKSGELRDAIHKVALPTQGGVAAREVIADTPYAFAVHQRPPEEDHAHEGEHTPEGHPGRQFLTRPLRFHQPEFVATVLNGAMRAIEETS